MYSKEKQQSIAAEMLQKCIEITETQKADVFFEYSPHIHAMSVSIFLNGWKAKTKWDKNFTVYFDWDEASVETQVQEMKENLDELLTE